MGRWMMLLVLIACALGCRDEQEAEGRAGPGQIAREVTQPPAAGGQASPEEVARLIAQLESSQYSQRVSAALRLGDSGAPEAAAALLAALREECALTDHEVATRSMEGPGLSPVVASGFLKGAYQTALWKLGPEVRDQVQAELGAASDEMRAWLTVVLGYLGDQEQFGLLTRLVLTNPDGFVREAAARALGHLGRDEAVPVLREALNDAFVVQMDDVRIPLVREAARAALKQLGASQE
ncbi:MAG: HEAT repeat domain-containing protein [Armatimonadota bacterium]